MANKRKGDTTRKLTPKQQAFVEHYTRNRNGADAYRFAYPASKKWPHRQVATQACKLLAHPNIATIVESRTQLVTKIAEQEFEITARRVLQELAALAFYKPSDYLAFGKRKITRKTKDGTEYEVEVDFVDMTPSEKLTETQMKAVVSAEMTTNKFGDTFPVIKLADRSKALVKLGEHLQLFNSKVDVKHSGAVTQVHEIREIEDVDDPKTALKIFEQFRQQAIGRTVGNA